MPRPFAPIRHETLKGPIPAGRPGLPNPIDVHVGLRIRGRRIMLGLSQKELGKMSGLTWQQIQKYERGANRVGASRLWDLSRVLDVPVTYFFDQMSEEVRQNSPRLRAGLTDTPPPAIETQTDPAVNGETLKLARAYYQIKDPAVRKQVFALIKAQSSLADAKDNRAA